MKKNDCPSYKQGEYLCKEMFPYKSNGVWVIVVLTSILKDYLASERLRKKKIKDQMDH